MSTQPENKPGNISRDGTAPPAVAVRPRRRAPATIAAHADDEHKHNPARGIWQATRRWFTTNTFAPDWLARSWHHPAVCYLLAALLQILAVLLAALLVQIAPMFQLAEAIPILAIVFIALSWGAGPSVVATLVGAALLNVLILPPHSALALRRIENISGTLLFLVIGIIISVVASQTERARRDADDLARNAQALALALALERARLDAIIEAVPDAISIHDAEGAIVRLNHAGQQFMSTASGSNAALTDAPQVYGLYTPAGDLFPPEQLPPARALRGEIVSGVEIYHRSSEEPVRYISMSAAPIRDLQGNIEGAVAVSHDITALRQAEHQARAHADQLEAIIEAMADAVLVYDRHGNILHTNTAARELLVHQPDYLIHPLSQHSGSRAREEDQERPRPVAHILQGEVLKGANTIDVPIPLRDGHEVLTNVSGAPVRDAAGHIVGAVIVVRDLTERHELEQRTREALDALLAMAQALVLAPEDPAAPAAQEPIPGATDMYTPATASEATRRLAELARNVLGGQRIGITAIEPTTEVMLPVAVAGLSPEQERQWWAEQRLGTRLSETTDPASIARLRAGEALVINMTQPPYNAQPNPYGIRTVLVLPMHVSDQLIGILTLDYGSAEHHYTQEEIALASAVARLAALVIERERLLRERAEAHANELSLRETKRRMDEFMAIASHELKTPLTTIKANIQLALRRINRDGADEITLEKVSELLTRTEGQIARLNRLVDDLLDVSRIQTGKLELHMSLCDLGAIVREAVYEQRHLAPTRTIILDAPPEGQAIPVIGDPDRLAQVVTNYLTNAIKYSAEDRPVQVSLEIAGQMARLSVRDEGPGLPPGQEEYIWERFHQAPEIKVQSGSSVGLGLGLHISRTIIERHQGQVGVQSAPGQGSTFWFTLPLAETSA